MFEARHGLEVFVVSLATKRRNKTDLSKTELMTGGEAVARAIQLSRPEVVAAYPITPQTTIVEALSKMVGEGELDADSLR